PHGRPRAMRMDRSGHAGRTRHRRGAARPRGPRAGRSRPPIGSLESARLTSSPSFPEVSMSAVRPAAVAGSFYPGEPSALASEVASSLAQARVASARARPPKAIIAPHAGYIYSGPIAASVYARLEPLRGRVQRVVLAGPAHRVWVDGIAVPSAAAF